MIIINGSVAVALSAFVTLLLIAQLISIWEGFYRQSGGRPVDSRQPSIQASLSRACVTGSPPSPIACAAGGLASYPTHRAATCEVPTFDYSLDMSHNWLSIRYWHWTAVTGRLDLRPVICLRLPRVPVTLWLLKPTTVKCASKTHAEESAIACESWIVM